MACDVVQLVFIDVKYYLMMCFQLKFSVSALRNFFRLTIASLIPVQETCWGGISTYVDNDLLSIIQDQHHLIKEQLILQL